MNQDELLVVLLVLFSGGVGVTYGFVRAANRRSRRTLAWTKGEHRRADKIIVTLDHRTEGQSAVGEADLSDPDFGYKIEELRNEAYERLAALNSGGSER